MNTEYLKEFIVLAETQNFWEASEHLFMNQSTLSKHIKALEASLGVSLFHRTTRHVSLTNYGRTFLPYAKAITRSEFDGLSAIRRLQNIENGLLTIGSLPSMPQYRITQLLANFQTRFPDISIRMSEDDPSHLFSYLENESCELIFTREDKQTFEQKFLNDSTIQRIPYIADNLVVIMQLSHPLANEKTLTLQQVSQESFCCIKEGSLMHDICMDACQYAGFIPDIVFSSHRVDSILDMVTNQNCIALLMDQHVYMPKNGPRQSDMPWVSIPVQPSIQSQISLCYRMDKPLSHSAQLFVDFCTEEFLRITL